MKTYVVLLLVLLMTTSASACTITIEGPTLVGSPISSAPSPTTSASGATSQPAGPTATSQSAQPTTSELTPTNTPAPAATTEPTTEPTAAPATAEPEPGPAIPPSAVDPKGGGLAQLGTFRQRMTVSLTEASTGAAGTYRYQADVNTNQPAMHIVVSAEGAGMQVLPSNQVEAIWIGTKLWLKVGNQPWVPVPEGVAAAQFETYVYAAGDFLPYVPGVTRGGPNETINGVPCQHWVYSVQNAQTGYGTVSGSGDIYTAVNGGYVVRYTLNGQVAYQEIMTGSGTVNLVYDTYDVGANITIQPPTVSGQPQLPPVTPSRRR